MRRAVRAALTAAAWLLVWTAAGVAFGAPAPPPATAVPAAAPASPAARRVTIQAEEMTVDAVSRVATASGRVRVTDGTTTATASRATLYHREGRGILTGQAKVVSTHEVLEGAEITIIFTTAAITRIVARGRASLEVDDGLVTAAEVIIVPNVQSATAQGEVTFFTPPDVIATGARLTYQRVRGTAVLEGRARVQNRDGFVQGARIEGFRRWERVVVTGGVHAVFRDIEVRSTAAEVLGAERKAVFTGEVHLTQAGRLLTTEKLTVWYAAGRFLAEGPTRVRIESAP